MKPLERLDTFEDMMTRGTRRGWVRVGTTAAHYSVWSTVHRLRGKRMGRRARSWCGRKLSLAWCDAEPRLTCKRCERAYDRRCARWFL